MHRWRVITWLVVGFVLSTASLSGLAADVSVTGSLSSKSITKSELLRFTLNVNNTTGTTLKNFRLLGPPDSYELRQIYADSGLDSPRYYANAQDFSEANNILFATVPPGASYTAWGYLRPTTDHESATLTMVVGWRSLNGSLDPPSSSVLVSLGENSVQGYGDIAWGLLSGFAKIFAIPLTLAIIGFLLNERAKKHQEQAEKEREARKQEIEQTRSLRAETWKQMLPVCHEYAAKYYLPLSSASQRLAQCLSQPNDSLAFFYLIHLARIMAETLRSIGGFYFKDLRGERLAAECWARAARALLGAADDLLNRAVHGCVVLLDQGENYGTFVQKFGMSSESLASFKNAQVDQAWRLFVQRLSDKPLIGQVILYLRAFSDVIDFEANRPFDYWYEFPSRLQISKEVEELLRHIAEDLDFTDAEMNYFAVAQTI